MLSESNVALRLVLLARPKGAWMIACLPYAGLGFGLWERGSTASPWMMAMPLVVLFTSWLFGHAGAMWLNAVLDRDEGPVLFGRPVPVPGVTAVAGYLALIASIAIASIAGLGVAVCAACCALLAIAYSHPRTALKGRPIGGPLVNGVGYGTISPLAGWIAADVIPTWRAALSLAIVVLFILGAYFSAQAFQSEEDRARGYRTLVTTHGARWTLTVARACLALGSVALITLALIGVYPRMMLIAAPWLIATDRWMARWRLQPNGGDKTWATRLMVLLACATLTVIGAAYVDHFAKLIDGAPPGGCSTAIVPDALSRYRTCARP